MTGSYGKIVAQYAAAPQRILNFLPLIVPLFHTACVITVKGLTDARLSQSEPFAIGW